MSLLQENFGQFIDSLSKNIGGMSISFETPTVAQNNYPTTTTVNGDVWSSIGNWFKNISTKTFFESTDVGKSITADAADTVVKEKLFDAATFLKNNLLLIVGGLAIVYFLFIRRS